MKYKKFVENLGHKVITATNARVATRIVGDYPGDVDAVISDVQMEPYPYDGLYFNQYINRLFNEPPPVLLHSSASSYKHQDEPKPIRLVERFQNHPFVEFRVKDDQNLYIKVFLERVMATIA